LSKAGPELAESVKIKISSVKVGSRNRNTKDKNFSEILGIVVLN
jgi:hypothetical protein